MGYSVHVTWLAYRLTITITYFISLYLMKTENVGWRTGLQIDGEKMRKEN